MVELAIATKATIILAFCFAALAVAKRAKASVRHLVVLAAFVALLALPIVAFVFPALAIHLPETGVAVLDRAGALPGGGTAGSLATMASLVWAFGVLLLLLLLLFDLLRLREFARTALPWLEERENARALANTAGIQRQIDVSLHERIAGPVTYGWRRPVILLPADARAWKSSDVRRALVHELEHVRRADWSTQLLSRLACIVYWPHPLTWLAWRRLSLEAERACDDAVIVNFDQTEYAEQLVQLARQLSAARPLASVAMAHRSDLSARIDSLLDGQRNRGRPGRLTAAAVVIAAMIATLSISSLRAGPPASMTNPVVPTPKALIAAEVTEVALPRGAAPSSPPAQQRRSTATKRAKPTPANTSTSRSPTPEFIPEAGSNNVGHTSHASGSSSSSSSSNGQSLSTSSSFNSDQKRRIANER